MDNYSKDNTKFFKKGVIFVSLGGILINEEWRKIKNEELRMKNFLGYSPLTINH